MRGSHVYTHRAMFFRSFQYCWCIGLPSGSVICGPLTCAAVVLGLFLERVSVFAASGPAVRPCRRLAFHKWGSPLPRKSSTFCGFLTAAVCLCDRIGGGPLSFWRRSKPQASRHFLLALAVVRWDTTDGGGGLGISRGIRGAVPGLYSGAFTSTPALAAAGPAPPPGRRTAAGSRPSRSACGFGVCR